MFFEGIENKVASGVKMEEVSYQLAYSKQELRKVIKEYPGKEVIRLAIQNFLKTERNVIVYKYNELGSVQGYDPVVISRNRILHLSKIAPVSTWQKRKLTKYD